jgi:hypothetical protein
MVAKMDGLMVVRMVVSMEIDWADSMVEMKVVLLVVLSAC